VNAGAIPDHLIEAELFGVRRGAFTGADEDRDGLIRSAGNGTLFLDEVAELPHSAQVKLLRVLDGGDARAVGSDRAYQAKCRFLAATNQDLKALLANGKIREDLYYRLAVFEIDIPTLEARRDDIPHLAAHFLRCYAKRLGQPMRQLAPETLTALATASWPGNVRQLENTIRRVMMVTTDARILPEHLPADLQADSAAAFRTTLKEATRVFERNYIAQALADTKRDKPATAERLGISLASLYEKIKRYGL
jgi:DNA-binding NtrC family response regulator